MFKLESRRKTSDRSSNESSFQFVISIIDIHPADLYLCLAMDYTGFPVLIHDFFKMAVFGGRKWLKSANDQMLVKYSEIVN